MPIPLGAVSDLVDPAYEDVADSLAEPQRHVLAAALGLETDGRARPDRLALPRALVAALRALAAERPLLLAVDDVQWLDAASVRTLSFALRRVGEAPIGVLATLRGDHDAHDPLGLATGFDAGAYEEVALGPLGMDALQRLVRERFDVRIPRSQLAAVHAASGGNPMFALEFARAARREGTEWRSLTMPSSLQELVRDRVRALPEGTRPLLELIAVIERPTLPLVARALGGVSATEVLLDDAVAAGAITVGGDGVLRFTHPLLGSAVYSEISPRRRRALHLQVADLVDDLEERARHLSLATSEADESIAEVVERAVGAAMQRGAPDAAAVFAAEALRLTPESHELRIPRTFACAGLLLEAGDVMEARALIEPLLDPDVPAGPRSQALLLRAETEHQDRLLMMACIREAIEIAPDPRVRANALLRHAQHGGWISGDGVTAAESSREAYRIALELNDRALIAASAAALAYYEAAMGRPAAELDDETLLRAERLRRMAPWQMTPAISVGARLLWAGELDRAREVLRSEHDELVRQGSLMKLPLMLLLTLADLEWRAGRWDDAETTLAEAQSILDDALPGGAVVLYFARTLVAGSRGHVDEARRLAAEGLRLTELRDDRTNPVKIRWALGHVELARGDAAAAWRVLDGVVEVLADYGIAAPGWYPILPDVVETLVLLGRLEDAEDVLRTLEDQAAALAHRWSAAVALRCRALLLLAHERGEEAAEAAVRAAAELEELGFPLDQARALLVAGAARRRSGQRTLAAENLRTAADILEELGAPLWLERAQDELRRASPRPRRDGELTSAERRVARLVVEGRTNREVAAELFVTNATVEAHLTRIYRKLGVRSRTALARAVAEGAVELEPEPG